MKTSRFSDSQILAILKQAEGGLPVPELRREHRHERRYVLQVASQIWRHGRLLNEAHEGTRGREPPAKEDVRRGTH